MIDSTLPPINDQELSSPKRTKSKTKSLDSADSAMSRYFQDIAAHRVLDADEELELAQDIETLEVEVWRRLLSFGPAAAFVAQRTEELLEEPPAELRAVAKAAGSAKRLAKAADAAAAVVRPLDLDKDALKVLMSELSAYEGQRTKSHGIGVTGRNRELRRWLQSVRVAARTAASAREAFARANLRLVISIARRYSKGPMALADLIQEGNLGLLKAVDRFDHRRGFRFSTYASWWIRHSVGRALADKGREVRVPVHMVDATYRLKKARRDLTSRLGRQPTDVELAKEAEIPLDKLHQMSRLLLGHPVSMNQPVSNDDERPMVEVFQDPQSEEESPIEAIDKDIVARELRSVIGELSSIETDVVRRRFGLDGTSEETLQEIADSYGRSRERIRQIQAGALKKLRVALARKDIKAA